MDWSSHGLGGCPLLPAVQGVAYPVSNGSTSQPSSSFSETAQSCGELPNELLHEAACHPVPPCPLSPQVLSLPFSPCFKWGEGTGWQAWKKGTQTGPDLGGSSVPLMSIPRTQPNPWASVFTALCPGYTQVCLTPSALWEEAAAVSLGAQWNALPRWQQEAEGRLPRTGWHHEWLWLVP